MQMNLAFGARQFSVDVVMVDRKRLSVTVHPDLRITAKAPIGYEPDVIRQRLEKKVSWIARQLDYFARFQPLPPERQYITGETHYYLGRQYRLRIRSSQVARVRLVGRFFAMELPDPNNRKMAKTLMLAWYSIHAKDLLTRRLARYMPIFVRMETVVPKIRFRRMKKRWGSCSGNDIIMLNTELVKAPIHCIDYVIVHELCHLVYPNHNRRFFNLLGRILPDWKKRKERLEKVII